MPQDKLDQFYTQHEVARECWRALCPLLQKGLLGKALGKVPFFVEPSAGDGVFYDLLPEGRRKGLDIAPRHPEVEQWDFLEGGYRLSSAKESTVAVGNPPFGKRGKLAVRFFQRAFEVADTVAFIVPVIFRKYFIHKQMPEEVKWIYGKMLPPDSFRTEEKSVYSVRTEFQVWTRLPTRRKDGRLLKAPAIAHPDFEMHQYNNTKDALKVFDKEFDFAVPCQGYQDYARRERRAKDCEKHKQWILFKARGERFLKNLREIDYAALAMRHTTSTPGFRKGDVVQEYKELYNDFSCSSLNRTC